MTKPELRRRQIGRREAMGLLGMGAGMGLVAAVREIGTSELQSL